MSKFSEKDVNVLKVDSLYKGFFRLNRYHLTHTKYDGTSSDVIMREVFERGHAAAVLLFDPSCDELVLIEQFRYPALETTSDPWLIEVVAGIIEPGETAESVCYRESIEEAGMEIEKLSKISSVLLSPGACTESIDLFIGRVDATKAQGIHGLDSEAEDIKVLRVKLETAREWLDSGKINNSTAIIAVQWLLLNKQKLLNAWQVN